MFSALPRYLARFQSSGTGIALANEQILIKRLLSTASKAAPGWHLNLVLQDIWIENMTVSLDLTRLRTSLKKVGDEAS